MALSTYGIGHLGWMGTGWVAMRRASSSWRCCSAVASDLIAAADTPPPHRTRGGANEHHEESRDGQLGAPGVLDERHVLRIPPAHGGPTRSIQHPQLALLDREELVARRAPTVFVELHHRLPAVHLGRPGLRGSIGPLLRHRRRIARVSSGAGLRAGWVGLRRCSWWCCRPARGSCTGRRSTGASNRGPAGCC